MKANKAPERIYIHPTLDNLYGMCERSCDSEIEYVRKDAFIEKACEWWMDNFEYTDDADVKYKNIWDFKTYMKGE